MSIGHGEDMPAGARGIIVYSYRVLPAPRGAHFDDAAPAHSGLQYPWLQGQLCEQPRKLADIFKIGAFRSYAECERKLRAKGFVQPDGTLKVQLLIRDVQ